MIVQIYGSHTPEEAAMVAALGAEHVGIIVGRPEHAANALTIEEGQRIFAAVPPGTKKVALTLSPDLDEIEAMARAVQPDILHLGADLELFGPEAASAIRRRLPGLPLMQAIGVAGPDAVELAARFQDVADYLLLDTKDVGIFGIGAVGRAHDWAISRRIVQLVRIPVILAGGLSAENVAEAIRTVRPYGVDSFTHTNYTHGRGKDPDRVRRFVEATRQAAASLAGAP